MLMYLKTFDCSWLGGRGRERERERECVCLGNLEVAQNDQKIHYVMTVVHGEREGVGERERESMRAHVHKHCWFNMSISVSQKRTLVPNELIWESCKEEWKWECTDTTWPKLVQCQCIGVNGDSRVDLCNHNFIVNHHGLSYMCFWYK
jgi:hypothetical protein